MERGPAVAEAALAICAEFDIRICPKTRYPAPGETRAVATLERILVRYGDGHLRLVLSTLSETKGTRGPLDEHLLWAVSDVVQACGGFIEKRAADWLEFWDACSTVPLQWIAQNLRGHVSQRAALAGMLSERLYRVFGDEAFDAWTAAA